MFPMDQTKVNDMTYDELLRECKVMLRFHPDEKGSSVKDMLEIVERSIDDRCLYLEFVGSLVSGLLSYIDQDKPVTPARGDPMPQTREYWEARALRDQELILEMKAKIERLEGKLNSCRQKLDSNRSK